MADDPYTEELDRLMSGFRTQEQQARIAAHTPMSDHYRGIAVDIAISPLPKWLRRKPRVVLWGGYRRDDIQFGSAEDLAWERSRAPFGRKPTFHWSEVDYGR